jgi:hypothetical protein
VVEHCEDEVQTLVEPALPLPGMNQLEHRRLNVLERRGQITSTSASRLEEEQPSCGSRGPSFSHKTHVKVGNRHHESHVELRNLNVLVIYTLVPLPV